MVELIGHAPERGHELVAGFQLEVSAAGLRGNLQKTFVRLLLCTLTV